MSTQQAEKAGSITPHELGERMNDDSDPLIVDVRTPVEFREVHLRGARNVPLDQLDDAAMDELREAGKPVHVVCQSGKRGEQATTKLCNNGVSDVVNVEGGTRACVEAGLPVVRGEAAMSLERQVRIAAGSLVLLGAILAMTVHVGFAGLSAFVGAGLVFAGLTDTCGMGLLLARMPWNRVCDSDGCSARNEAAKGKTNE